jgi:hypothetical protein
MTRLAPALPESPAIAPVSPPGPAARVRWDRVYLILYALYIGLGMTARGLGWIFFDAEWFVHAARQVLHGSLDLYSYAASPAVAPPIGATYAYSPLMALLIAPFVGLSDTLGGGEQGAQWIMALPLMVADVLAMQQLRRLVHAWRPAMDERLLCLGIALSLFITSFWQVTAWRGHVEGLMLLFLLLTLRLLPRSVVLGGLCAGLALATKHMVALELIPVGVVLLAGGARAAPGGADGTDPRAHSGGWGAGLRALLTWGAIAAGVFLGFVLPAALVNPAAAWYAFVTLPQRLILTGPGLPVVIDSWAQGALPAADYARLHDALIGYSNLALPLIAGAAALVAVTWARRRGQPITLEDPRLLGLVAFSAVTQVVFAKWVGPHYYQLPLLLAFLWDAVRTAPRLTPQGWRPGTFPWIGLGAAIAFRGISQFDPPPFKTLLILLVYMALGALLLWGVLRPEAGDEAA